MAVPEFPADASELRLRLRDGTRTLLRPVRPDDRSRFVEGLQQLSPQSRYLRFHASVERLSPAQLDYFTRIDYRDHMAWGAIDEDHPDRPGMGVARYVRLADEPDVAEAAITVLDAYQGRGLGTVLLAVLGGSALRNGIRVFRSYVLAENAPMLELFEELGAEIGVEGRGVFRVDLALPDDADDLPETPAGRVVRAIAAAGPTLVFGPPLWLSDLSDHDEPPTTARERGPLRDWIDTVFGDDP